MMLQDGFCCILWKRVSVLFAGSERI